MKIFINRRLQISPDSLRDFNNYFTPLVKSLDPLFNFKNQYESTGMIYTVYDSKGASLEVREKLGIKISELAKDFGLKLSWKNESTFTLESLFVN